MKKFLSFVLLAIVLFSILPIKQSFAYEGGLLNGKAMNLGSSVGNVDLTTNEFTDNNINTANDLSAMGGKRSVLWYEFKQPVSIESFRIYVVNLPRANLIFYDSDKVALKTIDLSSTKSNNSLVLLDKAVNNVSYVAVSNYITSNTVRISEFDVFEAPGIKHDEVLNFNISSVSNGVKLSWNEPSNPDFLNAKLYKNGVLLSTIGKGTTIFIDYDVQSFTPYTYKVTSVYSDKYETNGVTQTFTTDVIGTDPIDTTPPSEITNLKAEIDKTFINFTFDIPSDEDFDHTNIYMNGTEIGQTFNGKYRIENLEPDKDYSFKFTTVDMFQNESNGVIKTFRTLSDIDETPPSSPKGVSIQSASNGLIVSYKANTEPDLLGYNIYLNGVRHNVTPISGLSYRISGLESDKSYEVYVTAIDKSGNESLPSPIVTGVTKHDSIPIFDVGYNLIDVGDGVSSWFSSLWLILAFSVAIPISFYISARVKLMFLD